jgi:hypothetical protein
VALARTFVVMASKLASPAYWCLFSTWVLNLSTVPSKCPSTDLCRGACFLEKSACCVQKMFLHFLGRSKDLWEIGHGTNKLSPRPRTRRSNPACVCMTHLTPPSEQKNPGRKTMWCAGSLRGLGSLMWKQLHFLAKSPELGLLSVL